MAKGSEGFHCSGCSGWFDDGPPLVTVTGGPVPDDKYCNDMCAYNAGYSKAVVLRWESEANDGSRFITYRRPEYQSRLAI